MAQAGRARWQDWVNLVLGVWLILAPLFGLAVAGSAAAWNGHIVGAVVAVFALWALAQPRRWEEWINLVCGVWLIIAPFALGFGASPGAMWNHIIVGLLVGGDALGAMSRPQPTPQRAV